MKRIKVRFNLSRGKNYMKWKIEYPSGEVEYCSPTDTQLIMKTCQLKNNRKTAEKIFNGEHKSVCAWILCEDIEVMYDKFKQLDVDPSNIQLKYNPRITPNWVLNKMTDADGFKFNEIGTVDYKLYVTKF
jgi:thymidylate synthase